jgi:hypothetical protein
MALICGMRKLDPAANRAIRDVASPLAVYELVEVVSAAAVEREA